MIEPYKGTFIINANLSKKKNKNSCNIAAFDLHNTIIKYKNDNTSSLVYGVKEKLNELYNNDYKIVIFTNQSSSKFNKDNFTKKIEELSEELEVPLQVFGCTCSGYSKKPSIGMWELMKMNNDNIHINLLKSFYVGDAAGRSSDISDIDYKFALNIKIKFYIPDEYLDGCKIKLPTPIHPVTLINNTYECISEDILKLGEFEKEMIILVGPPACGKTTWCSQKKFKNYSIISQDKYKIKSKLISYVKQDLENNKSVIIDKRNEYYKDRLELIDIANYYGAKVKIVWFDIPKTLCEHMCAFREIIKDKEIPHIIISKYYSKIRGFEPPTEKEGVLLTKYFNINEFKSDNKKLFLDFLI
jgi:bifunctional polynucleotide phosphatase/kinase